MMTIKFKSGGDRMYTILTDMSGAYIEHSAVITNFVAEVHSQVKRSTCKVFPDNVQYKWLVDGEEKTVIQLIAVYMPKKETLFTISRDL